MCETNFPWDFQYFLKSSHIDLHIIFSMIVEGILGRLRANLEPRGPSEVCALGTAGGGGRNAGEYCTRQATFCDCLNSDVCIPCSMQACSMPLVALVSHCPLRVSLGARSAQQSTHTWIVQLKIAKCPLPFRLLWASSSHSAQQGVGMYASLCVEVVK